MQISKYLMPNKLRIFGIIFFMIGILLLILKYQFNLKPEFLNLKVFAIYSFYIEAKVFTVITHQMLGDLAGILLLSGIFVISFTREKEESAEVDGIRLKAFLVGVYVNFAYLLLSVIFFFGFGFVGAITLFMVVWLLAYLVTFRILLYRNKSA